MLLLPLREPALLLLDRGGAGPLLAYPRDLCLVARLVDQLQLVLRRGFVAVRLTVAAHLVKPHHAHVAVPPLDDDTDAVPLVPHPRPDHERFLPPLRAEGGWAGGGWAVCVCGVRGDKRDGGAGQARGVCAPPPPPPPPPQVAAAMARHAA